VKQLMAYLRVRGMQRGVLGGNRTWLGVWVGLTAIRFLTRFLGQPDQVERIQLKPGQALEIRDTGVTWQDERKQQKRDRRADRKQKK
jgi:hypothetical protein